MSILEELFDDFDDNYFSAGFDGNVRGSAIGQVAAHHAIPKAAANRSLLLQALAQFGAAEGDIDAYYNHNNFTANGQFLPTDADKAHASGMALHQSSHDQYTKGLVVPQLEKFQLSLETELEDEVARRIQNNPSLDRESAIAELKNDSAAMQRFMGEAAANIRGFQGYLRSGLVASVDANGRTIAPKLTLAHHADKYFAGKFTSGADLEAYYSAMVESGDILRSEAFVKGRDRQLGFATWDPDAVDGHGRPLSAAQRAALQDDDWGGLARSSGGAERASLKNIWGNIDGHAGGVATALAISAVAINTGIWVKEQIDAGRPFDEIFADLKDSIDADQLLAVGAMMAVGALGVAAVATFAGPLGVAALIAFDTAQSFDDLRGALKNLEAAMPDWEFLGQLNGFIDSFHSKVGWIVDIVFGGMRDLMPSLAIAGGASVVIGKDGVDLMAGSENAVLMGGAGNDWIAHFGSGEVRGDAGNDRIFGIGSEYVPASAETGGVQRLDLYGGGGNDLIALAFGEGGYAYGEQGDDILFGGGREAHLWGGTGADTFVLGSNTTVEDGTSDEGDSVLAYGIPLFGGVKQSWMEGNTAYWAPFTSILTAFPVVGNSILMAASIFVDAVTMKFAKYQVDSSGDLQINFGWGYGGTAVVRNYSLDLDSGVGTAGITVFQAERADRTRNESRFSQYVNLALKAGFGIGLNGFDPLVLDLDGDGYNLTTEANSDIWFEFDSDGFAEHTGWVRASDGFLVRDANANGSIDDVSELFGNRTTAGFDVLAGYDSNHDGVIDASDAIYASLQVWQDINQDGKSQAGELRSLAELGIVSINLSHAAPAEATDIGGNVIVHRGTFTWAGGATGNIADVALDISETDTRWMGDTSVSSSAALLPQLIGLGEVKDLRVAMTGDAALEAQVAAFVTNSTTDLAALKSGAETILYRWAGVDGVATTALGSNGFDARKLAFLEQYAGLQLMPRDTGGAIQLDNIAEMEALWADQVTRLTLRLAVQGPLSDIFEDITFRADRDQLVAAGPSALGDLLHSLITDLPGDHAAAETQWNDWAPLLGALTETMVRADGNVVRSDFLFAQLVAAMDGVSQPLSLAELAGGLDIGNLRIGSTSAETLARGTVEGTAIYFSAGGDDVLTGGSGQDVYVFGRDIGHVTINDVEGRASGDRIRFAMLARNDVSMRRDGADLLITVTATGETVRITGQFADVTALSSDVIISTNKGVEDIQFADGSVMEIPEIMAAVGTGTSGNDHIIGTMHSDVFLGGLGNDTLEGGDDADLYVVNAGEGQDIIRDNQSTVLLRAADMLIFGDDIAPEDLVFSRAGNGGDDLLISIGTNGDSVLIEGQFDYTSLGYNGQFAPNSRIEAFAFREYGDSWSSRTLQQMMIANATTAGNDETLGFGDSDTFEASAGNDLLIGLDGADIYHFGAGSGNDVIDERSRYIDVEVGLGGISLTVRADTVLFGPDIDLSDLVFARPTAAADLVITLVSTGETLTIKNQFDGFQTGPLGAQWMDRIEWFEFGDGSRISWQQVLADVTAGGDGDDSLWGDLYTDRLEGGLGNDYLSGRGYADTYVFKLGYGHDTIDDANDSFFGSGFVTVDTTPDILELGAGITVQDVVLERNGLSIDLVIGTNGDHVTLHNQNDFFHSGPLGILSTNTIEQVRFQDGTIWTWQQLNARLIETETTSGDDVTEGFVFGERFEASAGNDILKGGDGGDTYVFGVGSGHDIIRESVSNVMFGDNDVVEFASGILPEHVTVARNGDNLILSLSQNDSLTIEGEFTFGAWFTWEDIETFRFAGGAEWSKADIRAMLLQSTTGDDHLVGFGDGDTLAGGAGNDILEGVDGSDTYRFNLGDGQDVIRENRYNSNLPEYDRVVFGAGITAADLNFARVDDDLIITFDGGTDKLTIEGQFDFYAWLAWSDVELFEFADGSSLTDIQVAAILTGGTDGADTILGTFRSDVLDGRAGDDVLKGGDGADRYVFGRGYGHDEIRENLTDANLSENDQLEFKAGIALDDVNFIREDNDLLITIDGNEDSIRIVDQFLYSSWFTWWDVDRFTFADGQMLTRIDVQQMLLAPAETSDHYVGFLNDDTFDGGAGDDILEGLDGGDTYIINRGYGHDTILEVLTDGNLSENDTVRLGAGITADDVTITRVGQSLVITLDTGDTLTVVDHFHEDYNEMFSYHDIEQIVFEDGTVWSKAEIAQRSIKPTNGDDVIVGTWNNNVIHAQDGSDTVRAGGGADDVDGGAGNDVLYGGDGHDVMRGGLGDDLIIGDGGNDIFHFDAGDGNDIIREFSSYFEGDGGFDVLQLGAGIVAADVSVAQADNGNDLVITFANGTDRITLDQTVNSYEYRIEQLSFADGTVWSAAELLARSVLPTAGNDVFYGGYDNDTLSGGAGDDTLTAYNGHDVLDGGVGNDLLLGGGGDDIYRFGIGSGQDIIRDFISYYSYRGTDTIELGAGITTADITITQADSGNDLVIRINGTDDQLTIDGGILGGADYAIEQLRFADGTIWDRAEMTARSAGGTSGNDTISGNDGANVLFGGAGNDTLTGWHGNDILDGGAGNDALSGDGGNDIYRFDIGGGQDVVTDWRSYYSEGGTDTIELGAGVTPDGVTVVQTADGNDLVIRINGTTDQITLNDTVDNWRQRIEHVRFADGTVWSHADLMARATTPTDGNDVFSSGYESETLLGGAGNDALYGRNGNDILDGGTGNDALSGDGGDDVYRFEIGGGQDVVTDWRSYYSEGGTDTIEFGAGITAADLTVLQADSGRDLVIRINGTPDQLTLNDTIDNWRQQIEQIRFVDGTILTHNQLFLMSLTGSAGNDAIFGGGGADVISGQAGDDGLNGRAGADTLDGGAGNDTLTGEGGDDIYIFGRGYGQDIAQEWASGDGELSFDTIQLTEGVATSDVTIEKAANNEDLIIKINGGGDQLTLRWGINYARYRFEQIRFFDGTIWTHNDVLGLAGLLPTEGPDTIRGTTDADTINALSGDDVVQARQGNDVLIGGAGNDTLSGDGGDDTYVFNLGDGQDIVRESGGTGSSHGTDTIQLGAGITPSDVAVEQADSGNDLILRIAGTSDQITIDGTMTADYMRLERVTFADGTVWSHADLVTRSMLANSGNDVFYGSYDGQTLPGGTGDDVIRARQGNDVLIGGAGNDTLSGDGGDDTYIFNLGDGQDMVLESSGTGSSHGTDTIQLGVGIAPADVTVEQADSGNDLILRITGTSDQITIDRTMTADSMRVERVTFADGSVWSHADLVARSMLANSGNNVFYGSYDGETLTGGAGDDVIRARQGNDVLIGGAGNDTLSGDGGEDTYIFNLGDGQDVVIEYSGAGGQHGTDTIQLGAGITPADVILSKGNAGQDYVINIVGSDDTLTLANTVSGWDGYWVERIRFNDGTIWDRSTFASRVVAATNAADALTGSAAADTLNGLGGDDMLAGRLGDDLLNGEGGNDRLVGGFGNDQILGGSGNDQLFGDEPAGENLIINGSFEMPGPGATQQSWGVQVASVVGWTKIGSSNLELVNAATFGVAPADGVYWLDLDGQASGQNIGVSQIVSGLSAGQTLTLEFDAANRTSSTSGAFEVRWNGNVIGTISQSTLTMQHHSLSVTTQAGDNVLTFQGIGTADTSGASLDNVRLTALAPAEADGSDILRGGTGNDQLFGQGGDDILEGNAGNDTLDGGEGVDQAVFAGHSSGYTITTTGGAIQIVDDDQLAGGDDGTDTLAAVEQVEFGDQAINLSTPIVLDLDGDGIELVDATRSKARFDLDGDGISDRTGWIGKGDGILVFDRNGNGRVDGVSELSFVDDLPGARSDLEGLAAFDSNGDGQFSAADAQFSSFRVWKDKDGDGIVDKKELLTLRKAGVASISLSGTATEQDWAWGSNIVINDGSFTRTTGRRGALADVALSYTSSPNTEAFPQAGQSGLDSQVALMVQSMTSFGALRGEAGLRDYARPDDARFDFAV